MPISLKRPLFPRTDLPEVFDASGCFETCRVKSGEILFLKEHLQRLFFSLKTLGMEPPPLAKISLELKTAAREVKQGYLRVAIRRLGDPTWMIHRHPGLPYPRSLFKRGVSLITVASRQPRVESVPAQAKCSERLPSILARGEARESLEVLRIGPHGYLTEATVSNLFLVKDGTLLTPPAWLGVLEGVTRGRLLKAAHRLKIPVKEIPITRHDLFNADEAFLTNVLLGVLPVRRVDGRAIGTRIPGPLTRRLLTAIPWEA